MILAHVTLENFRGIRVLDLDLDGVTALIGENNYGKTSILDALMICLGAGAEGTEFAFEPSDFHEPADAAAPVVPAPIRIVLTFERRDGSSEDLLDASPLSQVAIDAASPRPRFRLAIHARRDDGGIHTDWTFVDAEEHPLPNGADPALLVELRHRHPMLLLRPNTHVDMAIDAAVTAGAVVEGANDGGRRRLEVEILRAYRTMMENRTEPRPVEIARGLAAADLLYGETSDGGTGRATPPPRLIDALVESPGSLPPGLPQGRPLRRAGTGTRNVAQLAVVGAMLAARGNRRLAANAHPVVALEDPEVHLHPVMLASLWELIEQVPAQTIISTNSGELLASVPMHAVRRLERRPERVHVHGLRADALTVDELRRIAYHIRVNRASAMFARCWLLVEGETEFWLLPELARQCGYHFPAEGVRCLEFAQCGVEPLLKLANGLGIPWHVLADGDPAGHGYAEVAREQLKGAPADAHVTQLRQRDIEMCLWSSGYADVYRRAAGLVDDTGRVLAPTHSNRASRA